MSPTVPVPPRSQTFSALPDAVAGFVRKHALISGVNRLGIAVSGGADSVALLHLLLPLCRQGGITVTVLHLNHGLRAESAEEESFVNTLAEGLGLLFRTETARLSDAPRDGLSLEMRARQARQTFFRRSTVDFHLDAIATGHQADDVAENLLLRLARGAGASGLSGLRPRSQLDEMVLIRPLLSIPGQALRDWLLAEGIPWKEDRSNRDTDIPRNFVRHNLLPYLEATWTPNLRARLCQTADILREDDECLDALAQEALSSLASNPPDATIPVAPLLGMRLAIQRRVLRLWLFAHACRFGTGFEAVDRVLEACRTRDDWSMQLDAHIRVVLHAGLLTLDAGPQPSDTPPPVRLVPGTSTRWGDLTFSVESGRGISQSNGSIDRYPETATLSADAIGGKALWVRSRLSGDRIAPTGLAGSKKIQDLFVDEKVPESLRDTIPLVVCDSEVAWVPGYRVARRFAVPGPDAPCVRITVRRAP